MQNEFLMDGGGVESLYAEVILPLALAKNYTYRIPSSYVSAVKVGQRVVVQFGKHKIYTALIFSLSNKAPEAYTPKDIIDLVDLLPIVNPIQLKFWQWLSGYYMCTLGEVMAAALPSSLKLASETVIRIVEGVNLEQESLNDKAYLIISTLLEKNQLAVKEVSKLLGQKTVYPILNTLLEKRLIVVAEEMTEKYKSKVRDFIELADFYKEEANLKALFEVLSRAPKQLDALLAYMNMAKQQGSLVDKLFIQEQANCSATIIKSLIEKGVFCLEKKVVSRLAEADDDFTLNFSLSTAQQQALEEIEKGFIDKQVCLLHGVTASGKTQLYIKLIETYLQNPGAQVLFLLPEIALTTQIVERLKLYFGNQIGVYHSKFNDNERVEIWDKVNDGSYQIVLGARSAIFLPFKNLQFIIVDEEHENSYKQYDPAPRYQGRDAAIFLAHLHAAKVLLGSATPSLESYYNAQEGKYHLVKLIERYGGVQLPQHHLVNITEATHKQQMHSYFSQPLVDAIEATLARKEQVVLFQNRRGFATIMICQTCGFTSKCVQCDVSLTYHKSTRQLHCHYCGLQQAPLVICPACGSTHMTQKGVGTERVQEELEILFPEVKIDRLDLDSTRAKYSMQQIIGDFAEKKTQILIGTQMIAKGLDFDHLQLIGILNADTLINFPDFRAYERSYQLLAQVSGRAGRRNDQGQVFIQTYDVNHRIIQQVIHNDYELMYETELAERESFQYPPFVKMIVLHLKHKDALLIEKAANYLGESLKMQFGKRILGPVDPLVSRVRSYYLKQLIIKMDKHTNVQKMKEALLEALKQFHTHADFKSVLTAIDVDPN